MLQEQFSKAKILIADDKKLHYLYLQKILHDAGYMNVDCLADSLAIQGYIETNGPDLLILNLLMPHLDGFQVMKQLHAYREKYYLPIIALSEEQGSDHRLRALQSGATDFLNTPYETPEILFRIRNMIEMRLLHIAVRDQNKILEEKVSERTRELKESQKEIIRRLAQAAEFRDNETGEHIVRISKYCARMGRAMGMDEEECELFATASPLHDIGKIGIPDVILLKPGRLSVEEFEVMKTHALIGAQLLAGGNAPVMKMARVIAMTHHEHWDGTGYPKGLKGDEIPLIGQICSLCDVFDALISKRVYKEAWTLQEAIKIIIDEKGKQFKPELVDKFEQLLPEFIEIAKSNQDAGSPVK